jgi:hypothetical protein
MEELRIAATKETPEVFFDGSKGYFSISGKSYPEDVHSFYKPLLQYAEKYLQAPANKTTLEFSWLYYNTATTQKIMKIIMLLKDASDEFQVNWHYKKNFRLIKEKGQEIQDVLDMEFHIAEKN